MLVGIYIKHPVFGMRALRYIDSPNTVIGTPPSRVQCAKLTGNLIYIILKLEHVVTIAVAKSTKMTQKKLTSRINVAVILAIKVNIEISLRFG